MPEPHVEENLCYLGYNPDYNSLTKTKEVLSSLVLRGMRDTETTPASSASGM